MKSGRKTWDNPLSPSGSLTLSLYLSRSSGTKRVEGRAKNAARQKNRRQHNRVLVLFSSSRNCPDWTWLILYKHYN